MTHVWRATVVTVSDRCAAGEAEDTAGPALADLLRDAGYTVGAPVVVPDGDDSVAAALRALLDATDLVVTTGGTGLSPRDRTPEGTRQVIEREVPGLAEAMRAAGRASTPFADLSRGVVGAAGATLVVNTPGSRSGATESLAAILPVLAHALEQVAGATHAH